MPAPISSSIVFSALVLQTFCTPPFVAGVALAVTLRPNSTQAVDPVYVYIHVPKCAGSSFAQAAQHAKGSRKVWPIDINAVGCAEPSKRGGLDMHCGLSELESCIQAGKACYFRSESYVAPVPANAPLRFIMMVRDPTRRVLSEYYFMKRVVSTQTIRNDTFRYRLVNGIWTPSVREIARTGSLVDWVLAAGNPTHNAITKAVVNGDAGLQAPVLRRASGHVSSCAFFDHDDYMSHWHAYYGSAPGSDVEEAINSDERLLSIATQLIDERFDFVGLAEYFDQSVSRLSILWGVKATAPPAGRVIRHESGKPLETEIDSDVLQAIRARNKLDIGLYTAVLNSKFWKGSAATKVNAMQDATATQKITWQSVLDGDREGLVFDPSVLSPTIEQ